MYQTVLYLADPMLSLQRHTTLKFKFRKTQTIDSTDRGDSEGYTSNTMSKLRSELFDKGLITCCFLSKTTTNRHVCLTLKTY